MVVFCIVGLVAFGILGIFSAKYRRYFRESLHCMKRQLTLRPCDTQFDHEMKAKISGSIAKQSERLARLVYKRFAVISGIFLLAMIVSLALVAFGIYNYAAYGNCNGPDSRDFCIFNPFAAQKEVKLIEVRDAPSLGNADAAVKIIEAGCYSCPYTRDAESFRSQILEKYGGNVSFTFKDVPVPAHELSRETAEAAKCAREQGKYWEYHDKLFEYQKNMSTGKIKEIAAEAGLDEAQFSQCFDTRKYRDAVELDYQDGLDAGIYATPTYFVNGQPVVGIRAFAELEQIVVTEIEGECPV